MVGGAFELVGIFRHASAPLDFMIFDPVDFLLRKAFRVMNKSAAVGQGQHFAALFQNLLSSMGCNIAGPGDNNGFAFNAVILVVQHILKEVNSAVAGGLGTKFAAAIFAAFTRQYSFPAIGDPLILTEHITDFTAAHANITRRDIGVRANMTVKLRHIGLAKAHDFGIGFSLGIEIRPALCSAHRQAGQRVFERLFKGQEFQDTFGNIGVKPDAAFIGTDGIVTLDPPATLDTDAVGVIFPAHTKGNHTIRLGHTAQDLRGMILFLIIDKFVNILGDFLHRLNKFGLTGIASSHAFHECSEIYMIGN